MKNMDYIYENKGCSEIVTCNPGSYEVTNTQLLVAIAIAIATSY